MTQAYGDSHESQYIVLTGCTAAQTRSVPNVALSSPHKTAIEWAVLGGGGSPLWSLGLLLETCCAMLYRLHDDGEERHQYQRVTRSMMEGGMDGKRKQNVAVEEGPETAGMESNVRVPEHGGEGEKIPSGPTRLQGLNYAGAQLAAASHRLCERRP